MGDAQDLLPLVDGFVIVEECCEAGLVAVADQVDDVVVDAHASEDAVEGGGAHLVVRLFEVDKQYPRVALVAPVVLDRLCEGVCLVLAPTSR